MQSKFRIIVVEFALGVTAAATSEVFSVQRICMVVCSLTQMCAFLLEVFTFPLTNVK